ncbi:GIY-YIG nuclease family protein [Enterococcus sp. LJL128]|uniref:GIY-YIG nuclease family protein n=1 Tax=Enterococcus sp. LJL51 TaxID=3416656 RepID=UPI003CF7EEBD
MKEKLKQKARALPLSPGVYLMKDRHGDIVYIGKAKKLKERVSSYFIKNSQHSSKVKRMILQLADFDVIHVDTELDALLLECRLIQQHRPMYNRQMNAFERYSFLTILNEKQKIRLATAPFPTGTYTFGPYTSHRQLPEITAILEKLYHLNPNDSWHRLFAQTTESTIDSDLILTELLAAFTGHPEALEKRLEQKMIAASENLHFIQAAQWRDDWQLIHRFFHRHAQLLLSPINQQEWHALWLPIENGGKCYLIYQGLVLAEHYFPNIPLADTKQLLHAAEKLLPEQPETIHTYSKNQIDFIYILHMYLQRNTAYQLIPIKNS